MSRPKVSDWTASLYQHNLQDLHTLTQILQAFLLANRALFKNLRGKSNCIYLFFVILVKNLYRMTENQERNNKHKGAIFAATGSFIPHVTIPNEAFLTSQFFNTDGTPVERDPQKIIDKFKKVKL